MSGMGKEGGEWRREREEEGGKWMREARGGGREVDEGGKMRGEACLMRNVVQHKKIKCHIA